MKQIYEYQSISLRTQSQLEQEIEDLKVVYEMGGDIQIHQKKTTSLQVSHIQNVFQAFVSIFVI